MVIIFFVIIYMGACKCTGLVDNPSDTAIKLFLNNVRPFDLIVFKIVKKTSTYISHVEVAITSEWCVDIPDVPSNTIMTWGSTMPLLPLEESRLPLEEPFDMFDQYRQSRFGIQMRVLKDVIYNYTMMPGAQVGVCKLVNNPSERLPDETKAQYLLRKDAIRNRVKAAYEKYGEYYVNPLKLLSAIYPSMQFHDKMLTAVGSKNEWLFCSLFVALLYDMLGIIITDIPDTKTVKFDIPTINFEYDAVRGICELPPIWITECKDSL